MNSLSQILAAASDPSTPADVLKGFADSPDRAVQRATAANPNTPVESLRKLWELHPDCILANPVLELWEFARAESAADFIGQKNLLALFNLLHAQGAEHPPHIFTPGKLLSMARTAVSWKDPAAFAALPFFKHARIRSCLVANPARMNLLAFFEAHAPDAVWMALASDPDADVRRGFAELLHSSGGKSSARQQAIDASARALARDTRPEVLAHLAHCSLLPADLVERLHRLPDPAIREGLARCVFAPLGIQEKLAADPDERVRLSMATHSESTGIHRILLRDPSAAVRKRLAQNRAVLLETLSLFDPRDDAAVVEAAFDNPNADSSLRERILREAAPGVQSIVAKMGGAYTPAFHKRVRTCLGPEALALLAEAPRLPRQVVEDLACHADPLVRLGIAKRLRNSHNTARTPANSGLLHRFARDPDHRIRLKVCTDWRLDKASTAALFADPAPDVRKKCIRSVLASLEGRIRRRFHCSYRELYEEKAELLVSMASDPSPAVRQTIADSSEAPPGALGILFDDPVEKIREAARAKDRWPYGALIELEKCHKNRLRGRPLAHGMTTPGSGGLGILAKSPNPFLRLLTARCRRTAKADLKILANDPHPAIRKAARARLHGEG